MREIGVDVLQDMLAQETESVYLAFITISDGSTVLRFVNDNVNHAYDGHEYSALPFTIKWPSDTEQKIPTVPLLLDGVDQRIIQAVRKAIGRPLVTLEIVRHRNNALTNVLGPIEYTALTAKYGANQIELTLSFEYDYLNGAAVMHYFNNVTAPGLF